MVTFFDTLVSGGEPSLQNLIATRAQENLELEFKEKRDANNGRFDETDRRILGKALSAFSNSAGGVIIFGIEARKIDSVDCAKALKPIKNIDVFLSEAQSLVGQLLQPKHDGIRLHAISTQAEPGAGYLVIEVPRSERRPHRSEAKGHQQYFKRSGDSSFAMEHYDIEDAFRRVSAPTLEIECRISSNGGLRTGDTAQSNILVNISVRNTSRISARNCYISVLATHSKDIATGPIGVTVRDQPPLRYYELDAAILNPGVSRILANISFTYNMRRQADIWLLNGTLVRKIIVGYGCLDCAMQLKEIEMEASEILSNLDPAPVLT